MSSVLHIAGVPLNKDILQKAIVNYFQIGLIINNDPLSHKHQTVSNVDYP